MNIGGCKYYKSCGLGDFWSQSVDPKIMFNKPIFYIYY